MYLYTFLINFQIKWRKHQNRYKHKGHVFLIYEIRRLVLLQI